MRKYNNYDPNDWTDYVYFGANVVAERAANGDWSDYIFAGGKRVAKADTFTYDLLFYGTNCSNCGSQYSAFDLPSLGDLSGYVIRTGDKLKFAQYQDANARGGMVLFFSDGSNTAWTLRDSDGELVNTDHRTLDWHFRSADLSAYAGKTLSGIRYTSDYENLAGDWILIFADVTLLGGDGAVHSIYNGQRSASLNVSGSAGSTRGYYIRHLSNVATYYPMTTTFYDGDHLGSTTETTRYGGWPTWAATYLPYGAEYNAVAGDNHYKFTGMERDTESGLDHTWFRQYNAQVARWYSPDPLGGDNGDPQSLNRFAYVLNNPSNLIDPLGLRDCLNLSGDVVPCPEKVRGSDDPIEQFEPRVDDAHNGPGNGSGCSISFGLFSFSFAACPFSSRDRGRVRRDPRVSNKPGDRQQEGESLQDASQALSQIQSDYDAYKACTGPSLWKKANIPWPKLAHQRWDNPSTNDEGTAGQPNLPESLAPGEMQFDLAMSTAKRCLAQHPLAALDPRFNDIQPGEAF